MTGLVDPGTPGICPIDGADVVWVGNSSGGFWIHRDGRRLVYTLGSGWNHAEPAP
jgi:hypothetical protein